MSDMEFLQLDCEFDRFLGLLGQESEAKAQVKGLLQEVSSSFAAQVVQPDAAEFSETCYRLTKFLGYKTPLDLPEQKLVVQSLQVASAIRENALNNPKLSKSEHEAFHLAIAVLIPLFESAMEGSIDNIGLWCDVFILTDRAEKGITVAADGIDIDKYFGFENMPDDILAACGITPTKADKAPSPTPASTTSNCLTPRASAHDITDGRQTSRSVKLEEKALMMLRDRAPKVAPLRRAHTMPSLSNRTFSHPYPRENRPPLKGRSRGHGLHALQEIKE